jgi:hypothetical protein
MSQIQQSTVIQFDLFFQDNYPTGTFFGDLQFNSIQNNVMDSFGIVGKQILK